MSPKITVITPSHDQGRYSEQGQGELLEKSLQVSRRCHFRLSQKWPLNYPVLLALIVFIANIRIYWLQVLVRDDYYYGLFRWKELGSLPQFSQESCWIINRWLCWIAGNANVYLARSLILFCMVLPSALLIYAILKKLKYPEPVAFFTAAMVWIFPGQSEIPYFVNGSYTAEAMLFMLLSFWSGLEFIENENGYTSKWLVFTLAFYFWSLQISELVVPCTLAVIFSYVLWSRFKRKALVLSLLMSVIAAHHTYFKIINNGRDVVAKSIPFSLRGFGNVLLSFVDWCMPATGVPYIDNHMWYKWILFAIIMLVIIIAAVGKIARSDMGKGILSGKQIYTEQRLWQAIFPLLLFMAPLIVMSIAPWFNVRHAIFPAIGFYLLLSFAANALIGSRVIAMTLLIMVITVTVIRHDLNIDALYSGMNSDNSQFLSFINSKSIPPNSQIVVVNMDVATCGYGYWSTGYLEYAMKRKDVSGLIGREFNLIDPFKKHEYTADGMNGLSIDEPLFLYRKNNGQFEQLRYFLQWKQNNANSDFVIYEVDAHTGKLAVVCKGDGLKTFLTRSRELSLRGVKRSDILWGGEFTPDDRKRVTGLEKILEEAKSEFTRL